MTLLILAITFVITAVPVDLFAWGLETHVKIGTSILENVSFALIKQYPTYFLLGNIFPDFFTLLKDLSRFKRNLDTHSWGVVSKLFKSASKDADISFAHGYAAHLAADVIAHNYLIPQNFFLISKNKYISHLFMEYAESCSNEHKYASVLDTLLNFADSGCEFFLSVEGINKEYFQKQLNYLKLSIKYQHLLKLKYFAHLFEKVVDPSFKNRCKFFHKKALEVATNTVEYGFSKYTAFDPTGKEAMKQAKGFRKLFLASNYTKQFKKS